MEKSWRSNSSSDLLSLDVWVNKSLFFISKVYPDKIKGIGLVQNVDDWLDHKVFFFLLIDHLFLAEEVIALFLDIIQHFFHIFLCKHIHTPHQLLDTSQDLQTYWNVILVVPAQLIQNLFICFGIEQQKLLPPAFRLLPVMGDLLQILVWPHEFVFPASDRVRQGTIVLVELNHVIVLLFFCILWLVKVCHRFYDFNRWSLTFFNVRLWKKFQVLFYSCPFF